MTRELFRKYISQLERDVIELGNMCIAAIEQSVEALKRQDVVSAKKIVEGDIYIDNKRWEIEDKCISIIALQQPVASDLREIVAIVSIVADLERIGDYAEGIAKIVIMIDDKPLAKVLDNIPKMTQKGIDMLYRSLKAFIDRDAEVARKISDEDDEVDTLHDKAYHTLLQCM
ncbi:MAG TPA: phosphate signaling complex protein PhoU, partial [Sedimentisphaerales bacterium]|nr:phosphate signaling complex protein PhoU [Sedimentisphaerales bacterium]